MANEFFKDDGENIVCDVDKIEAYIPAFYFEKGIAELEDDHFILLGIFNFRPYINDQFRELKTMNVPVTITSYPSSYKKETLNILKTVSSVEPDVDDNTYIVLTFIKGDIICRNKVTQSVKAFQAFLNLLLSGKLPSTIPYKNIINLWQNNFKLNGISFDIPMSTMELIISEIYRNKNNPEERFGKVIGKNSNISELDYVTADTRSITAYNSLFAGITFEDMDEQLIRGLNSSKSNKKETISPMEQIMKY